MVVNVLVAWGCALLQLHQRTPTSFIPTSWNGPTDAKRPPVIHVIESCIGFQENSSWGYPEPGGYAVVAHTEAGLPWRAFSGSASGRKVLTGKVSWTTLDGVWPAQRRGGNPRTLPCLLMPYAIRPFGFIANVSGYAIATFGVLFAPGVVRRWRRRGRGVCVGCGYDLNGIGVGGVCPECGA